jgi:endo-1,4-beta-xylanase
MNHTVRLVFLVLAPVALFAAERGEEIRLWPKDAPGSEGVTAAEVSKPSVSPKYAKLPGNFTETHYPSIYVFLPPKEKATGAAMVVGPGGGHRQLVMEKEGWEAADWLNDHGIAAIVLKYRLSRVQGSKYKLENEPYLDAARAFRVIRSRASEWGIDPKRVGFIGFSAGGEVGGLIGV